MLNSVDISSAAAQPETSMETEMQMAAPLLKDKEGSEDRIASVNSDSSHPPSENSARGTDRSKKLIF